MTSASADSHTYVPVFPDRVRAFSISCDVPKSDSIARGLTKEVSANLAAR